MAIAIPHQAAKQMMPPAIFMVILLIVWAIATAVVGNSVAGFAIGLIAATFATGAGTLRQRRDGSFTLKKHR